MLATGYPIPVVGPAEETFSTTSGTRFTFNLNANGGIIIYPRSGNLTSGQYLSFSFTYICN